MMWYCGLIFVLYSLTGKVNVVPVNRALLKPVKIVSTFTEPHYGNYYNHSRLTDGITEPADVWTLVHSKLPLTGIPNWLYVDLQSTFTITSVGVRNRDDCCVELTRNFSITVWEFDPGPHIKDGMEETYCTCTVYPGIVPTGGVVNIPCTTLCTGRFVAMIALEELPIHIVELQVFGEPSPPTKRSSLRVSKWKGKKAAPSTAPTTYTSGYLTECFNRCKVDVQCLSFNYRTSSTSNNCQLMRSGVHPIEETKDNPDWSWFVITKRRDDICLSVE